MPVIIPLNLIPKKKLVTDASLRSIFILFFLSLWCIQSFAQTVSSSFIKTTDSLIKAKPITYNELDAYLKPKRTDTVYMRYFANKAAKQGFLVGQSYALNQLGRKYRDISQFGNAIKLHNEALKVAVEADNIEFRIFSLNMLSVVYRRTDSIKSALDFAQEALSLAETIENPSTEILRSINVSLNGIGNIYKRMEQYDLAIAKFSESLIYEKKLGNVLGMAINYHNIGECYEAQDKLTEALENFNISLKYNNQIKSEKGRIICQYSIAHVYVHQDKPEQALSLLETILPLAERLGDKTIISEILINLGWTYIHTKKYSEAENNLRKGLEIAQKYNLADAEAEAVKFLSELSEKKGDFETAIAYYKEAKGLEKKISNNLNIRYVNDIIMRYEAEKTKNQMEALAKENELIQLKLRKNNTTLLVSGLALALLAGILYILYRQYQLNNEKKVLTLEQSMLRSQMNPHFLFNSLNSIKLYIINNEKKNAVHYLNKFSKLVRKILEASSMKEISLADELETVELYMNIENIRFSNEIDFKISIDDAIDTHNIKIPSLILQPFLENAIWHGLSSKEGEKKIELHISKENQWFTKISVSDNGVGREMAQKIKEGKVLKRKSVGIDITKERLANFSKDYQNSFEVEMVDLYDDENQPAGTTVILYIPTV
ncbi:tetratricopeptide (TPR) repeat protein [Saonia flava]|uniref:Tetratricopeptide (TPR) repeat protein n=1 Tax=Saonia flava TaxID=523696 RepID=A0A846QRL8_9FLAO|nr:tetratricopeptide repeat protein [Saonia flava]NJB71656.1 tetratricopeptide (TPR) repeat protein [Saonia flava]